MNATHTEAIGASSADRTALSGADIRHPWAPLVACFAIAIAVLLPFALATHCAPVGMTFRGTLAASGDESQYLAAIRMGSRGDWLWHDPFMVRTPPPVLMYPVYLLAGHLAAGVALSIAQMYAILHVVGGVVLIATLWRLAAAACGRPARLPFVATALLMSGPYWLVALLAAAGHPPVPLNAMGSVGLSGLTMALMSPHLTLGVAGQIMALTAALMAAPGARRGGHGPAALYGMAGSILTGLTFPVLLPLTALILLGWTACSLTRSHDRSIVPIVAAVLVAALPFIFYYYIMFRSGPWSTGAFTRVAPASPQYDLLAWGVLLPFAYWGWRRAPGVAKPTADLLALWVVLAAVGARLPFWQGPRFETGIQIPIGALFAVGVAATVPAALRPRAFMLVAAGAVCHYLFLLAVLSNGAATALYGPGDEAVAMRWIAQHADHNEIVLAPLGFSNVLPAQAGGVHVVAGHEYQTLDYARRSTEIAVVYNTSLPTASRLAALRATGATLVVAERLSDGTSDAPPPSPLLRPVFHAGSVTLYRAQMHE